MVWKHNVLVSGLLFTLCCNIGFAQQTNWLIGGDSTFPNAPLATIPQNFKLTTSGNQILLNGVTPVKLKGVVRPSLEWNNQGQFLSITDLNNIRKFGANVVRLDLNADYWNSSASEDVKGSYRQIINAIIYYAAQENMLVILDYHWSTYDAKQENMAPNNSITRNFWQSVATQYKNFDNIIFELYNEPHDIDYNTWLNGNDRYIGMQDMYNIIRNAGANNLVIVNGVDYGYYLGFLNSGNTVCKSPNGNTLRDCFIRNQDGTLATNVIYGSHPYTYNNTNKYKGAPDYKYGNEPADFASNFAGVKANYPLIFTEFGDNSATDYSNGNWSMVYDAIISEIAQNNINYTGFAWWIDSAQPAFPTLITGSWDNPVSINGGSKIHDDLNINPGTRFNLSQ